MKFPLLLIVVFSFFLEGCTLEELSVTDQGPEWAPRLGVKEDQLQFLSHCGYRIIDENVHGDYSFEYTHPGIVALTNEHVVILDGNTRSDKIKEIVRIPFSEMEVSHMSNHVQLRHGDNTTIIRTYVLDRLTLDQESSENLFSLLTLNHVPEFAGYPYMEGSPIHLRSEEVDPENVSYFAPPNN